jgi:hypothetical protein
MICPHCGKDTSLPPSKECFDGVAFDAFWQLFPRKVAKASALKAWKKAATSEAVKDAIMAGLKRFVDEWRVISGFTPFTIKYFPHASTWLNGRRWEDENPANPANPAKRVIACEKCGDTGTVNMAKGETIGETWVATIAYLERCSCPFGQLPGLMVGRFNLETGELISNETP